MLLLGVFCFKLSLIVSQRVNPELNTFCQRRPVLHPPTEHEQVEFLRNAL